MVTFMKKIFATTIVLTLAGCGPADNEPGPGGVTVGEARALDEAAEMVEAKRLPKHDTGAPIDEQPEAEGEVVEE